MKISRILIWSILFLVFMIVFSATIPLTIQVEYYYPCRNLSQVENLLPLICGGEIKVTFKLRDNILVAEVEDVDFTVAKSLSGNTRVLNKELWSLFLVCCEMKLPPQRVVNITSVVMGVIIALLLSTITSSIITCILAKVVSRKNKT